MKVKEAVKELMDIPVDDRADAIITLCLREFNERKDIRFKGRDCSVLAFDSLNVEMNDWIKKVMFGCGLSREVALNFANRLTSEINDVSRRYIKKDKDNDFENSVQVY